MKNKCSIATICLLFFMMPLSVFGDLHLKGSIVHSEDKSPIAFVAMQVMQTSYGCMTDDDGCFELLIPDSCMHHKLILSHVNFEQKVISVSCLLKQKQKPIVLKPKSNSVEDIIISANLYSQKKQNVSYSVQSISHREIEDNIQSNLIDVVNRTPGFSKVWEYHSPIILRGLNSNRLLILKNGSRRIGTFPGGYFGQDMNIYDTKKVEIIKGPASVVYGSGAISGIINVIGRSPLKKTKHPVRLFSAYGSNNHSFLEVAQLRYARNNWGLQVNGKYRKTGDMHYADGVLASNSGVEDRDVSVNGAYRWSLNHHSTLNLSYHYGDWGKPRGFNGPTKDFTKINNIEESFHLDLSHSMNYWQQKGSFHANIYFDQGNRDYYQMRYQYFRGKVSDKLSAGDIVHYSNLYGGARLYNHLALSNNNTLTYGMDYYLFKLDSPKDSYNYFEQTSGSTKGYEGAGQSDIGVYIKDEWSVLSTLKLNVGFRSDWAHVTQGKKADLESKQVDRQAFSGNLGCVYTLTQNNYLSINIGRAFRMPTSEELFAIVTSCKGIKAGNPSLKPEYSWNYDIGLKGLLLNQKMKYDLSLFVNDMNDFIGETASDEPGITYTYLNTDALLMGGELSASYQINSVFSPYNLLLIDLGASYVYGIDESVQEKDAPLFGIPPLKLRNEVKYVGFTSNKYIDSYKFAWITQYAAAQNRYKKPKPGSEAGPWGNQASLEHWLFDVIASVKVKQCVGQPRLTLKIHNVFDTYYKPFGSFIPAMGRNIQCSVTVLF